MTASIRVLVVDDYEPFRHFYSSTLQQAHELQIIAEASDGLGAVRKARELQPDLILLDIGLPTLNGIEAARQIRKHCPASKILFVSENRSVDVVKEALSTGAGGYVVKSDAAGELLLAIKAILDGKLFISTSLADHGLNGPTDPQMGARFSRDSVTDVGERQNLGITQKHEAGFYSDDRYFLDEVTRFVGTALRGGNAAIVVATESHKDSLLLHLQAAGLDMAAAIEERRYIQLDAADVLSMFMVNGMPDPVRFLELLGDLIVAARESAKGANPRVSVFGECVHLLWAQGNAEAAIQMEKLGNKLTKIHAVDILCGYSVGRVERSMDHDVFQRICAEHSAGYSR